MNIKSKQVYIQNFIQRLCCSHEWEWERDIYGDEINHISILKVYRSEWRCRICGKQQLSQNLRFYDSDNGEKLGS